MCQTLGHRRQTRQTQPLPSWSFCPGTHTTQWPFWNFLYETKISHSGPWLILLPCHPHLMLKLNSTQTPVLVFPTGVPFLPGSQTTARLLWPSWVAMLTYSEFPVDAVGMVSSRPRPQAHGQQGSKARNLTQRRHSSAHSSNSLNTKDVAGTVLPVGLYQQTKQAQSPPSLMF